MPNHANMPYRNLGKCGAKVSAFGLGGWTTFGGSVTDERIVKETILSAFDAGINFFDIADVYAKGNSEIAMGKVLKNLPRHELIITSKVYFPISDDINDRGLSRKHVFESVHKSLDRIGTNYLDIYFCHRFDVDTPLEETVRAMSDLVTQGKIMYWGTSEWRGDQLKKCHEICEAGGYYKPQVEQPEYSLLQRGRVEKDLRPFLEKSGMGMVTWSPLASGMLTGKYNSKTVPTDSRLAQNKMDWLKDRLFVKENFEKVDKLIALSKLTETSPTQLALAWVLAQPQVSSVILGVTKKEQLEQNLKTLDLKISHQVLNELKEIFPA